jgi:UDP-N-acetylmuramoyl-tripeptide--D-alanyl-D-alanine ligase
MRLTAAEIAKRAGGGVVSGDPEVLVTSWGFDSRALLPGACFVALRDHRDGHDFVAAAFRAGAHVALIDREVSGLAPSAAATLIRVPDVVAGLQSVARSVRAGRSELRVVGVTGSTGKTSTKDLLAAALPDGAAYASPESYNNEFGLPLTLLNTPAGVRGVVAEMGERFPGDIALLCDIARPEFGIVTNVGLAHAEHLGGREGVAAVLAELLEALPESGTAVLPADDEWTPWLAQRTVARVETVGYAPDAAHRITHVDVGRALHPEFTLDGCRFRVGLRGAHQVINAAMAAVMARDAFGIDLEDIAARMEGARGSRWRMELAESAGGVVVLNDAYNANPASMDAALRALAQLGVEGRRIAVLGDMRELGTHSAGAHEAVGRLAGELGTDVVIGVGAGGAEIAGAARRDVRDVRTVVDADEAAATVLGLVQPGDAVLVKASRALGLQTVAERLLEAIS